MAVIKAITRKKMGRREASEPKLTTPKAAVECPSRVEMPQIPDST